MARTSTSSTSLKTPRKQGSSSVSSNADSARLTRCSSKMTIEQNRFPSIGEYRKTRKIEDALDDDARVVGVIRGTVYGNRVKLLITHDSTFAEIGRAPSCDLRLFQKEVSLHHLRIYSCRTTSNLTIVCLHDISRNGFTFNGIEFNPGIPAQVGDRVITRRSVILRDGDEFSIPRVNAVFRYTHNFVRHGLDLPDPDNGSRPRPMFGSDDDATATYKVGHWIIYNYPLGVGTYATVHLAAHQSGELQVACKSIALRRQEDESCPEDDDDDSLTSRDSSWVSPTDRRKLGAEVEILKKLDHRNVASFLDVIVEEEHERIHLIVELVTGGDLWNYTAKHGSFSEDEVRFFAWQLVKALSYLHGHGIAHRDLKPENILLHVSMAYPRLIITDFGQAKTYEDLVSEAPQTRNDPGGRNYAGVGTFNFLPPERLKAHLKPPTTRFGWNESVHGCLADWRASIADAWMTEDKLLDSWALGCILFGCMSGNLPYTPLDIDASGLSIPDLGDSIQETERLVRPLGDVDINGKDNEEGVFEHLDQRMTRSRTQARRTDPTSNLRQATGWVWINDDRQETYHTIKNSAKSWEQFRKETGFGGVGDTEHQSSKNPQLAEQRWICRRLLSAIDDFTSMPTRYWAPAHRWDRVSANGIRFIDSLLQERPAQRLRMDDAFAADWFVDKQMQLEEMYDVVVKWGGIWQADIEV